MLIRGQLTDLWRYSVPDQKISALVKACLNRVKASLASEVLASEAVPGTVAFNFLASVAKVFNKLPIEIGKDWEYLNIFNQL